MGNQKEHILVCLSASPNSFNLIKTAATIAKEYKGQFTALYVETPTTFNRPAQEQLQQNINFAKKLGANIETAFGIDIAFQIAEFTKNAKITKVFIGKSNYKKPFYKTSIDKQLFKLLPNIDLNVIYQHNPAKEKKAFYDHKREIQGKDIFISISILLIATLIGLLFHYLGFSEANTITVYILSVLITAIATSKRSYSLISSILSVLIFNFLFTNPRFTLAAYGSGYPVTFLIMLIAAFITSTLAIRIKQQAKQSAKLAYRTKVLLETNRLLQKEKNIAGIKETTAKQIIKLLNKDVIICQVDEKNEISYQKYFNENITFSMELVLKCYHDNKVIKNKDLYLPIASYNNIYGVMLIILKDDILDTFENNLVSSIIGECALSIEKEIFNQKKEEAAIEAKNERLRANLLRSISHDLRTPLTSISGNASVLINNANHIKDNKKLDLYMDIYDDSMWLINLVENLLSVTRIEDNTMHLNLETELIDEVIIEALNHVSRKKDKHELIVINSDDFILVKIDAHLIMQVIINIVDNAIKYTPAGSKIIIKTEKKKDLVEITISDNGPGLEKENKDKIFDMFYIANHKIADGRRGLGLGLALCKAIINAHGGNIIVKDNIPKGSIFSFTLPIKEVQIHE